MGCRHIFIEVFDEYGIRDPNWQGDLKYYLVRQCLGYVLNLDEDDLADQLSPDTDFVTKYHMYDDEWKLWFNFIAYITIQFELPNCAFKRDRRNRLSKHALIDYSLGSGDLQRFLPIRTLRQATEFVLKNYSESYAYIRDLSLTNADEAKYQKNEIIGRLNAYRLERAREERFSKLIKNPVYNFFHDFEQKLYPRKESVPELRFFDYTDFAGCFKSYQKYYKKYYHVTLKYRWQVRKGYNIRYAKYIGYELIRQIITFRKTYNRSSWDRNYRSHHDYNAWLIYLKKAGDEYDLDYKIEERIKRERRKRRFRHRGVQDGALKYYYTNPLRFYCGKYLRRQKTQHLEMGYRFFDPPKKKYYEYPI